VNGFFAQLTFPHSSPKPRHIILLFLLVLFAKQLIPAQENPSVPTQKTMVVENVNDTEVIVFNKDLLIKGQVKGAMTFGGDVVVEGLVEGDVATVGGSVIQRDGAFIGGDVIILGGSYNHGKTAPYRNPNGATIIYAGYEEQLRGIAQDPSSLLAPQFSWAYVGSRILVILFWFVISLAITTLAPGAISRAMTRLQLSSWRVAIIGFFATLAGTVGVIGGLSFFPTPVSAILSLMALILLLLAFVFGYVVVQAHTGKILQRLILPRFNQSESVSLLLGAFLWTALFSLPYIWTFAVIGMLVVSLGLVLTARTSTTWKKA
jgi:hypothetical protein